MDNDTDFVLEEVNGGQLENIESNVFVITIGLNAETGEVEGIALLTQFHAALVDYLRSLNVKRAKVLIPAGVEVMIAPLDENGEEYDV